ncbi:MAG: ELM1/GtrOC1 family putative glycosyltransferase [Gammaproteobacteria bacterium]
MTSDNPSNSVIWRLCDGKAGHETQSKGLAEAINRLSPCEIYDIHVTNRPASIFDFIQKRFPPGENLPNPRIIIGAGHGTHISLLNAKRARSGLTIVLMKPTFPMAWFDYCLIPKHDHPPDRDNVISTRGALNSVTPATKHMPDAGLVLIGGPSRHFNWDPESLIGQLQPIITQRPERYWTITDSPRTPETTLKRISEQGWKNIDIIPFTECNSSRLHNLYAKAGTIWVSEDSISMVYEALTSGAKVGLLEVPQKKPNRVSIEMKSLLDEGLLTSFMSWHKTNKMKPADHPINEAVRCAKILLQRGLLA